MWVLLRTDHAKEFYVARQVEARGFTAWVPAQLVASRPQIARRLTAKAKAVVIREIPVLPRRVLIEMPPGFNTDALQAEIAGVRHVGSLERNAALEPLSVHSGQVAIFRAEIDRLNTATLALATKRDRKVKAKWRALKDALLDMVADGRQQMEEAA